MIEIVISETFNRWLGGLRDRRAVARINQRLDRVANGLLGDVQTVGEGVSEMRIHYGPGYRLYYVREDKKSSSCYAAAIKAANDEISSGPNRWLAHGKGRPINDTG